MSVTIFRVKRKLDQAPAESLVVSVKKSRSTDAQDSKKSTSASFFKSTNCSASTKNVITEFAESRKKPHESGINECPAKSIKLVDLDSNNHLYPIDVDKIPEDPSSSNKEHEPTCAYDFYVWESPCDVDVNYGDCLVFPSTYRDFVAEESSDADAGDSDSNSESNWRNDYPDEDEFG